MAADQQIHILNDYKGSLTESADLKLEEVEKNIRVLITKLKGTHMNEGKSLFLDAIASLLSTQKCPSDCLHF